MADFSLADVSALMDRRDDGAFGGSVGFIILLFIFIWAVFGGNGFGGRGGETLTQAELQNGLYNQTTDRNLSNIRDAQCSNAMALTKDIMQTNYDTLLGFKDQQMQMAQCCCETQKTIIEQNQLTRDAINELKIGELADKLAISRNELSNMQQNQYLLSVLGNWYSRPSVNPCTCFNTTCGCNF